MSGGRDQLRQQIAEALDEGLAYAMDRDCDFDGLDAHLREHIAEGIETAVLELLGPPF